MVLDFFFDLFFDTLTSDVLGGSFVHDDARWFTRISSSGSYQYASNSPI